MKPFRYPPRCRFSLFCPPLADHHNQQQMMQQQPMYPPPQQAMPGEPPMQEPPQQMYQQPPQQMYQQPPQQMPPMVQEAPQLAQAPANPWGGQSYNAAAYSPPVPVSGPTESSDDDKQQQRAQAAASIEAYEMYMKTGGAPPAAAPAK